MPANLTPEYKSAQAAYRKARDPEERLRLLREMLRTIPKHKGTDHLQAGIKSRIKELTEESAGPRKGAARVGPTTVIRREGAAQVALVGPPNVGKSALHARLTGSHAQSGPYPFTTQVPQPGMLPCEDVAFQLVDLPSVSRRHPVPWLANALQPADGCLLVVDLGEPGCVEQVLEVHEVLVEKRVWLTDSWPADGGPEDEDEDPFSLRLPTLMVATKADLVARLEDELAAFGELTGRRYPSLAGSAATGDGLDRIGPWLLDRLGIVRVYTKAPGRPPDLGRPYTIRQGQTVLDVAVLVHKELAESLKYARLWGGNAFDGRQVGRDHPLSDGDVVELHP
ncbi:MAG: GTPase [Acidimicrobiia bacterium]